MSAPAPVSPGPHVDAAYLEAMFAAWRADPRSVAASWRFFFAGMAFADGDRAAAGETAESAHAQSNVASLIYAYRSQGHLIAQTDPLGGNPAQVDTLALSNWGFGEGDLERVFDTGHLGADDRLPLREILAVLRDTYCRSIGVEYIHIQERSIRRWLQQQMEPVRNRPPRAPEARLRVLDALVDAEQLEAFSNARFPAQKRFSLEGAETLIPALEAVIEASPGHGVEEIVFGMAHRGRLNVLANILGMSPEMIFTAFEGNFLPETVQGDGDVKYHRGYSSTWTCRSGHRVHLSLTANPSHLEAVVPVVEGRVRAKQRQRGDTGARRKVLPLLIHGDAAFAGQGVVAETLNLSQLEGYRTGGTVHIIINNQIGFTTLPREGRSSPYPTDVAKMIEAPIFHVNGDDPEAVVWAMVLALSFRQTFDRDVVVDMVCYRRHGHNEGDDPAFTQPALYAKIKDRPPVRALYQRQLVEAGVLESALADTLIHELRDRLAEALATVRRDQPSLEVQAFDAAWEGLDAPFDFAPVDTRVAGDTLETVARALCTVPDGFCLNPKIGRHLPQRLAAVRDGGAVDWAFAELLAFGTLLASGTPVRLSGQDSARGTFSQRHAVWQDVDTQASHTPLQHIGEGQARFCVYNSALSEAAVLGFEYGYSLSEPRMLLLWEAQFGDFVNGAQVIIDQFLLGAESKWQRDSGLVLLLPHGYEGQGPEHSNAYLERFLHGGAEANIQVCNLTTPAQLFHALRRQMKRPFRMPLVLMTPKSMLRHPRVTSPVADLTGGGFEEVLADPAPPKKARRLVLCSGRVFWTLYEAREADRAAGRADEAALVRIEQLYPLHEQMLAARVELYREVEEVVWAQEEPQNRGAWRYLLPTLQDLFSEHARRDALGCVARAPAASAATGSLRIHQAEEARLVAETLRGRLSDEEGRGTRDDEDRDQGPAGRRVDHRRRTDVLV